VEEPLAEAGGEGRLEFAMARANFTPMKPVAWFIVP
jgi:hypothetical protein